MENFVNPLKRKVEKVDLEKRDAKTTTQHTNN